MCPECHRFICEESCPAYRGRNAERGKALLLCSLCSSPIWKDDRFYSIGVRPFCKECLEERVSDELVSLFGYESREALIEMLGGISRIAYIGREGS
ncbi:MAG: hypothetical protein J6B12_06030 [Clostridia bacterium]|nr:hypothetical protein [Clostridia bacterium]